ncbi:conserved hypothetical protein [Desulfarculus baarsii DSM 2075]|uniref:Carboxymuconolactone decarboxylase n=1 Tax=Desulfarculus baarsii (strain ATCC 33931 / DSM 2075 / LMG 7858 / VKM B-1802 / 2st14) TaxID=644282 RepID=E1QDZ3_DESB2|nr:hypothetical protein [Desulfarculus baarsii]ADK83779.1 conserved hypothetical protein [Desulfarculus baarsii DSM 2075]
MPLLKIVPVDQAQGEVKANYEMFTKTIGTVPQPFQMWSASPALQSINKQIIGYYMKHPTLKPALMALIRMLVSEELGFDYCISFNAQILKTVGVISDDQLGAILADPTTAPLDEKDKAMLLFVLKACKSPEAVEQADVDGLRALGWADSDILDAAAQGASMIQGGVLFRAFKMAEGQSC